MTTTACVSGPVDTLEREDVHHLANESLLELRVQVRLWFLDEDQMDRRTVFFDSQPLRMEVEQFNDHKYEVLEP